MRLHLVLGICAVLIAVGQVRGQTTPMDKLKAMTGDLDALDAKSKEKEKFKTPFDFYKSNVAPFDILPFLKRNHWATLMVEMQANLGDYDGQMQTSADVGGRPQFKLLDMPHAMIFRRDVRMPKGQRMKAAMSMYIPDFPPEMNSRKELIVELTRPDSIRSDAGFTPILQKLEIHQMVIPILSPDPNPYAIWNRMQATIPTSSDRESAMELERQRYYRLVLPLTERPSLSPNPLTWTTTSHILWDGLDPQMLTSEQRGAMIDWLHFGGQVIVVAAGPTLGIIQDSFLGPYLPATSSGQNFSLTADDLKAMSQAYRPALFPSEEDPTAEDPGIRQPSRPAFPRYKPAESIEPATGHPLFLAGLEPKPGATAISLGDPANRTLGVEWRVGRGRVLMLGFNPNDPTLAKWTGMGPFVRRVILRRVEEDRTDGSRGSRIFKFLSGPEVTWVRLLGRDLGAEPVPEPETEPNSPLRTEPVGAWLDTHSALPLMARESLEKSSGITVPPSGFVLKVILAYLIALIPVNYAVCRFVLRRREWAWIMVPILALGFAITVERAAAYDMGFDSDCSEIDLLEIQGSYSRGHLSRFASLYSTGRDRYTISYPNDPTALALPLNNGPGLRGEETALSVFQTTPDPALTSFAVQPRSLSMFRSEAVVNLPGGLTLVGDPADGKIENATGLDLHDAVVIDTKTNRCKPLGTIGRGAIVPLDDKKTAWRSHVPLAKPDPKTGVNPDDHGIGSGGKEVGWTDPRPYLDKLIDHSFNRPEDRGEIRLVAWADGPHPGESLEPKVDRHRGFRLVVAHLRFGPPPDPSGPDYYRLD